MLTKTFEHTRFRRRSARSRSYRSTAASAPPIKLAVNYSQDDLSLLAARDNDPFNRWQALQTIATRTPHCKCGRTPKWRARRAIPPRSSPQCRETLDSEDTGAGFCRTCVGIAERRRHRSRHRQEHRPRRDLLRPRQALRAEPLATRCSRACWECYSSLASHEPYSPDATSAGRRTLRNACLDYIAVEPGAGCHCSGQMHNIATPTT